MNTKHGHNEYGDPHDPHECLRRARISVIRLCRDSEVDPSRVAVAVIEMNDEIARLTNPAGPVRLEPWQLEEAADGRR